MAKKTEEKKVSSKKIKTLEEFVNLIKANRTVMIASIKNLPSSQFQLIKKKLRENAEIKVVKKNVLAKAIDSIEKGIIKNFKKYIKEDTAIIFSNLEPFELSAMLSKNKSMTRAKIGQIVDIDIEIEPGPTEVVPGPVISELGALGLKFAIEDGKISIKDKKTILKAGDKVSEISASIMNKLDMKPVSVCLEPLVAYDSKEEKIFENIKIDSEKVLEEMKKYNRKAFGLAVKIAYACKDTIKYLLGKANAEENRILGLIKQEKKEIKEEEKQEIQGGN